MVPWDYPVKSTLWTGQGSGGSANEFRDENFSLWSVEPWNRDFDFDDLSAMILSYDQAYRTRLYLLENAWASLECVGVEWSNA